MGTNIDQLFSGMKTSKVFGRGNFLGAGNYVVQIERIKAQTSEQKIGETFFVCEFKVIESDNEKYKPGTNGTWLAKFSQRSTFGNVKELMFAALGKRGSEVPDEHADHELVTLIATAACGGDAAKAALKKKYDIDDASDLIAGQVVRLSCVQTTTRAGGEYTRHQWYPGPAAT